LSFLHYLWCMVQRSLHVVTKVYYRSMSGFATVSRTNGYMALSQSMSQSMIPIPTQPSKTEPIAFPISREAIPYQTRGGTCCPRVSTLKIRSLADSRTTCHDGINHLHHSNHCSNHNIDPNMAESHLGGWKTTTLPPRHKPTQHHKGWKTCTTLMTE
jgi:hypothetical protein